MPRFHFHVRDGVSSPDEDGHHLLDFRSARMEAVRMFGAILKESRPEFWASRSKLAMVVTDATAKPVLNLTFAFEYPQENPTICFPVI